MIAPELLALLVCPETHQDIALATPDEIGQINAAIQEGKIRMGKGAAVDQPIEGALIRSDRKIAYPIRDGIPVMLVSEGLAISQVNFHA